MMKNYGGKKSPAPAVKRVHRGVQGRPPADPDSKAKAGVESFWKSKGR